MAEADSSLEKTRQLFYDYLKKEDIDEVEAKSQKRTIKLFRRMKLPDDPWLGCFYFKNKESDGLSVKYSAFFASGKNLTNDDIADFVSNRSGITDEELNRCKAALRREIRSRNLPDLSSQPERLQELFSEVRKKFYEDIEKQKKLSEQINQSMTKFKNALSDCLETFKPLRKITLTSDTTIDTVTTNITKMKCMKHDLHTHANAVMEHLFDAVEKFEIYQEADEKMDGDLFNFIAHCFPNFLIPRAVRMRSNENE